MGNTKKNPNFDKIVAYLIENLRLLGCNMSIKLHLFNSDIDYFSENLGSLSEEHDERFH